MGIELNKSYNPKDFEDKWYSYWQEKGYFSPRKGKKNETFSIVIPPPNVTAVLHMGHGLNNTIQDILIRYKRMSGYEVLWVPGTDHAGIATQNVVEKELAKEGKKRTDFTREAFIERVWKTALSHQGSIISQLKKMGCSADWNYNAFTFDEERSRAVKKVFIELYNSGMVYKSKYIVNWCPRCNTALADDEVEHENKSGRIWYIKYPVKGTDDFITVATTRPETMLGDTAIAFGENDERFLQYKYSTFIVPIVNREIIPIYDSYVDPAFGTGAVKVTPAHDPNDFEMGKRHNLEFINIMNNDATMNEMVPEKYRGLDRYECRKLVVKDLEALGLLVKVEVHANSVGQCYRCDTVVEPRYSDQWFVKMKELAAPALQVVEDGKIEFLPARWIKVYNNWLTNIRDWCISRQLWWGHRIPVYVCQKCFKMVAAEDTPAVCDACGHTHFVQEEDVLDTWFSSWLWPFSTLGWPDDIEKNKRFYPTSTLVTGPDIIFFWVARMIMAGLHFMKDIPFNRVFFTGMVMDLQGRKMSKSLGNGIDPFDVIERHGADALRYTMIAIVSPNQNLKLGFPKEDDKEAVDSFEIGARFANKIWNASRYILMNIPDDFTLIPIEKVKKDIFDSWILSELNKASAVINEALENARFNDAAKDLQAFFWHNYCDYFVELSKTRMFGGDQQTKNEVLSVLLYVLKEFLKLLHPIMPFITEEIYQTLPEHGESIMIEDYPVFDSSKVDVTSELKAKKFFDILYLARNIRGEMNVPLEKKLEIRIKTDDSDIIEICSKYKKELLNLAKGESIETGSTITKPKGSATGANEFCEVYIPLEGIIDVAAEIDRLTKELGKVTKDLERTQGKLNNESFVSKAPPDVIEKENAKLEEFSSLSGKLTKNIEMLKGL
ncbi:MAG: valine--tRNA ligase [Spirochaetes bacterium GWF1_31_7]|nr:MAG: valine--tRNA ligase [Spirochaetes bacterium GWE1_32_154]OHD48635.1 MAG: valine--tRNA ligase [Spirochaetes bacterium GWE2_31_10]OHD49625.1 MAG: valine--tRNA ligase [Spirochaetes bacterium GWF1_31_7]OHD79112.1 MAG: valine--tRNA ligase [Spirochaetes bacterium RIFOXYB1_FULL_32_8]